MINKQTVLDLVNEKLDENTKFYLIDLKVSSDNKIYVEIDHKTQPISITDCIAFSRQVEHNLDRESEDFELEVASPGLSNPFKVHQQYIKNKGKDVKVMLKGGKVIEGELAEIEEEYIVVKNETKEKIEGKKKKVLVQNAHELKFEDINQTKIVIKFK